MQFAGISYLAVVAAAVASYVFGAIYYMALSRPWLSALGKTQAEIEAPGGHWGPSWTPFALSFVAQVVMAWVFAGLIGHLGPGQVTVGNALISALFVWVGFIATTTLTNHAFAGQKPSLTLIDSAHWLGVLLIQGLVIGLIGVTA